MTDLHDLPGGPITLRGDIASRIDDLSRRFRVTARFLKAYLKTRPHVREPIEQAADEADLYERLGPLLGMYVRYALTTTQRGESFLASISDYVPRPRRFLDIGCAYGGFLRALRARNVEVVGIEKDPGLAYLARENISDVGGEVHEADVLTISPGRIGQFDLIACNDVIEHVASATRLIEQVGRLLQPGGFAYFEIPNAHALSFVTRDGHFQQFGITLLPRELAASAVSRALGKGYDDMGEFHEESAYIGWFADAGLVPVEIPQPHAQPFGEVHRHVFDLVNAFTWWFDHQRAGLAPDVGDAIVERYWAYASLAIAAVERARRGERRMECERRYLMPFWTFLLRKTG